MTVTVETLEKLERRVPLTLSTQELQTEVEKRLRKLARTVKMDGFRVGKVPMSVVSQRYGYSVHYEVVNDKVNEAFVSAVREAGLRVAGRPKVTEREGASEGTYMFDATFEVFPDVVIQDLAGLEVERVSTEVTQEAIEKTIDILRRQRRTFNVRAQDAAAQDGDRITCDFEGKIDGEPFEGGKAEGFQFQLGEGQMLKEFEDATRGMKQGESKTFPLQFPEDYHGKAVAGKTADFLLTVTKVEAVHLPEVNEALAKSLGIEDGSVEGLYADIRKNLDREVKFRILSRNKKAVIDAVMTRAELDVPKVAVDDEVARMIESAREELRQRGLKDADKAPMPEEMFRPQAEQRVRIGLVIGELLRANGLDAKQDQLRAQVEELASSYEKPAEVVRWYYSAPERLGQVRAMVVDNNITDFVLSKATVRDTVLPFDELMNGPTANG